MKESEWPAQAPLVAASWMAEGQRPSAAAGPCPIPLQRRLAAAKNAGFSGVGLNRADYERLVADNGLAGLARMLGDSGLTHVELETVTGWWLDDPGGEIWRRPLDLMLELCARFPVWQIKVNGDFGEDPPSLAMMRDGFARMAEHADGAGTVVGIEPVSFSNVRSPAMAREILGDKAGKGGGVTLDCWHFARLGLAPDDMGGLTGDAICGIEFSNIAPEIVGSLFEDTVDHRRLPDRGIYDIAAFVRAVAETGYRGAVGCEVLSIGLRAMEIEDALQVAADSARNILARAARTSA